MSKAFVLMTAMPPTKGHKALIDFAAALSDDVTVVLCTQPDEPFWAERYASLRMTYMDNPRVTIHWIHKEMEQDANARGFWEMWYRILDGLGCDEKSTIVSSEAYGRTTAALFGANFIPFDPKREMLHIKGTTVRKSPMANFDEMIPEFQQSLRRTITIFGAESVGKTTLSKEVAGLLQGHWTFEWARPYLEMVGSEITDEKMTNIWHGQDALQYSSFELVDRPFIIRDTDLYSTIGYWELWSPETVPGGLYEDAALSQSNLYVILSQNIPFEPDQLRYGGGERESDDQYWIDLCERHNLNYVVVDEGGDYEKRLYKTYAECIREFTKNALPLWVYERKHNA